MISRIMVFAVLAACAALAGAQQYKWVDSNGRTQYGDTPPPGVKATRLKPPPSGASAATPVAPAGKKDEKPLTPEQAFQKRQKDKQEAEQKAAKEGAEAEAKRENCLVAQSEVRSIQSGQRMMYTNKNGERVYMDDSQVQRELDRAQKAVSDWCK